MHPSTSSGQAVTRLSSLKREARNSKLFSVPEIFQTVPLAHFVYLCAVLFSIGVIGVLTRRNAIIIFMSVELMLNAVNLLLVAFSSYWNDPAGQVFVFFVMV